LYIMRAAKSSSSPPQKSVPGLSSFSLTLPRTPAPAFGVATLTDISSVKVLYCIVSCYSLSPCCYFSFFWAGITPVKMGVFVTKKKRKREE
jgi:hypothetical protein